MSPDEDKSNRLRPSETQQRIAQTVCTATGVEAVMVPIALPGKARGLWITGQVVEHPNGFWPVDRLDSEGYRSARDAADKTAGEHLGTRGGVAAYCVLFSGGDFAVFEGICGSGRAWAGPMEEPREGTERVYLQYEYVGDGQTVMLDCVLQTSPHFQRWMNAGLVELPSELVRELQRCRTTTMYNEQQVLLYLERTKQDPPRVP